MDGRNTEKEEEDNQQQPDMRPGKGHNRFTLYTDRQRIPARSCSHKLSSKGRNGIESLLVCLSKSCCSNFHTITVPVTLPECTNIPPSVTARLWHTRKGNLMHSPLNIAKFDLYAIRGDQDWMIARSRISGECAAILLFCRCWSER